MLFQLSLNIAWRQTMAMLIKHLSPVYTYLKTTTQTTQETAAFYTDILMIVKYLKMT